MAVVNFVMENVMFLLAVLASLLIKVSGLTLTVQSGYFQIGSSFTLDCNLGSAAWSSGSTRIWRVPPSITPVITNGAESGGYTEDISDAASTGIFRMTTPSTLSWEIENELFQCAYSFSTASLNATRDKLSRNSGSSVTYDDSVKKCVFTISEILPSPSKVITLVQASGQTDISTDISKVTETLNDNNDQGQTYSYRLEVASTDLSDGDQVIFQVTAGPYSMNETCRVTEEPTTVHGSSTTYLDTTDTTEENSTTDIFKTSLEAETSTERSTQRKLNVDDDLVVIVMSSVVGGIILIIIIVFGLYFVVKRLRTFSKKKTSNTHTNEGTYNIGMVTESYSSNHNEGESR